MTLSAGGPAVSRLNTYADVVSGPVDAADGHAQTTQAELVHVTGDGAAQARVATQTIAA